IYLNGSSFELCVWPSSTRDFPEERCPGIGNPEENCPGTEEELVEFFFKKFREEKSREEIKAMIKHDAENNKPCTEDIESGSLLCTKPRRKRAALTPLPL